MMLGNRSIASTRRPAAAAPIDPAAITPSDQLGDLQLDANGRSSPFAELTHPAFDPPSDCVPPSQTIRPIQLETTADWREGEWHEEIQGDRGFATEEEDRGG